MSDQPLGDTVETLYRRFVSQGKRELGYPRKPEDQSTADWQARLRARLLELLGIAGEPDDPPPVRLVEHEPQDGYVRHRGYMVARDDLAVPFYLLEPDPKPDRPMGICVAAAGHGPGKTLPVGIAANDHEREMIEGGERDYAVQAVRRGYLAVSPDFRGFGELMLPEDVRNQSGSSCTQLAMRAIQLGRTLLGQRVSDTMQLLDRLLARDDVDPARVVMTGNSGGGTMTLFTSAVDRRITAAAPSCYFCTFAASTMDLFHCPCNFVPNMQNVAEMSDLAGLFAPKPMLIIAGTKDPIFPIDAVREAYAELRTIYADADAAENLELFEGAGGHRYYAHRVWDFFEEKLGSP